MTDENIDPELDANFVCLDCGLSAAIKSEDLNAWKVIGCPECGANACNYDQEIDIGTMKGSIHVAVRQDDDSLQCRVCDGNIKVVGWDTDHPTIMRESTTAVEDCPVCDRAFERMRDQGVI
jgi:DNA-directed RNA polymerase subunit RPC12/RpoP